jgi:glycosyltransferase involved in cell wall biosynthesis
MNVLFCTPSYSGNSGDALNERQLIDSLSKRVGSIFVLNLVDIVFFHPAYRKKLYLKSNRPNIKLINIPVIPPIPERFVIPFIIRLMFYNLLIFNFAAIFRKAGIINKIYVRNPEYAFALSFLKRFSGSFALKFAGFHTQEALALMKGRIDKWIFFNAFERIEYYSINKADALLLHSSIYEIILRKRYNLDTTKPVLIAPAGVDLEKLHKIRMELEERKIKEGTALKIGIVGSVTWWDGLDILLDSMPYILKSCPNVVLVYVNGIVADPHLLSKLRTRANSLGSKVQFKGPLTHEEALAEMYEFSALVLPRRRTQSTEITIPIKVKEALALGVPVIVTSHRIIRDSFVDTQDLLFVEPDPQDVARKVILLLSDPSLSKKLSQNGSEIAKSFSYDIIAKNFEKLLQKI